MSTSLMIQSDDPIARRSIPPFASGHRKEIGGASKTDEGATSRRRTTNCGPRWKKVANLEKMY